MKHLLLILTFLSIPLSAQESATSFYCEPSGEHKGYVDSLILSLSSNQARLYYNQTGKAQKGVIHHTELRTEEDASFYLIFPAPPKVDGGRDLYAIVETDPEGSSHMVLSYALFKAVNGLKLYSEFEGPYPLDCEPLSE